MGVARKHIRLLIDPFAGGRETMDGGGVALGVAPPPHSKPVGGGTDP